MRNIFIILFTMLCYTAYAQNAVTTAKTAKGKAKDNFEKGLSYYRVSNYPDAIKSLDAALKADANFIDALTLKATVYNASKDYKNAELAFENALKIDEDYDADIWFSLAQTERQQEKYLEAATHYERFIAFNPRNSDALRQAKQNLANCRFIENALAHPVPFDPKPLPNTINNPNSSEYLPCLTADGETLIFTRRINGDENFWISHKKNDTWSEAQPIDKINTNMNEGAQTITADGKYMVFTACNRPDGFGSCDLYFSELGDNGWTKPKNLGDPISTKAWESQPSLSSDGKLLFFTSNREGGVGGRDIWVSSRDKDKWTAPINLGTVINTNGNEEGPFIHHDNQTLYFMSDTHPGMGKYDIFLSRKDSLGKWLTPTNIGYPINTTREEGSIIVSLDGKKAMFASDRKYIAQNPDKANQHSESFAQNSESDLYEFDLYEAARPKSATFVKGKVYDAKTLQPLRAKIEISDLATNAIISTVISDNKGVFLLSLPIGKNYAFSVNRAKYAFYSNNFALKDVNNIEKPFLLDIPLIPLQVETNTSTTTPTATTNAIILKNVFFETGSAQLLPISTAELDRLKQLLDDNPTLKIRLTGHTDNVGSDADNMTLSNNRAKAVYDYLIQKGIASTRLSYKGFGETQPIATNDTAEGRKENRRTAFEIISY